MNKVELVEKMAAKAGMTKADAKRALDAFMESTQECLKKGESLTLIGFGSFGVSKRAARTGHNPQKPSETIKIPAKNVVSALQSGANTIHGVLKTLGEREA